MPRQLPSWWAASQCDSAVRLAWRTGQRSMGSGRRKRTDREQVRLALGSRGDGDRMPRRVQAHGFSTSSFHPIMQNGICVSIASNCGTDTDKTGSGNQCIERFGAFR